ncbi:MAG: glycosyltransferase [Cyclobacteriaceae bacterium]|mgnify:CR=1 FL=1|nr:glycosyltransferase [Cyclobacteriaceae bacterium]MCB9238259.1 glycosyltransferase [Flammeovirgaceae bacterium]MCO5272184.1 glycosyltransferase [Cyclobacteriaceae bacterium]
MKIAYLYFGAATAGVHKKLVDKVSSLDAFPGVDIQLFQVVTNEAAVSKNVIRAQSVLATRLVKWPFLWRLAVIVQQGKIYRAVERYIKNSSFDVVIMRYPGADFFLWNFLRSARIKIVFEHNTLELEELRLRAKDSYWYRYFYWGERIFGKWARRKAAGLIGVTEEITKRQALLSGKQVPVRAISNGIALARVPVREGNPYQPGQRLNILFLAGSDAPWHGIDILLNSIEAYPHQNLVHCCIVGNVGAELNSRISRMANVVYCPAVMGGALDKIVAESHIGVGSLALFRNQMKEACTLKVREYWARALPFVIGHCDTDVMSCPEASTFCLALKLDGNTAAFDFQQVVSFAGQLYSAPEWKTNMELSAKKHIDYEVKAVQYLDFLKAI